jgi:hypothetical protein
MKTTKLTILLVLLTLLIAPGCNNDNDPGNEDNPYTAGSYLTAKINGEKWESKDVIGSFAASVKTLNIVAIDSEGNAGLSLYIENYNGPAKYSIGEDIIVQWQSNAYKVKESGSGYIEITKQSSDFYEGNFEVSLVSVFDPNDNMEIKDGKFKARIH